ncbi:MAG: tetratricopeptide repeat-containing sensor histidine kinase [Bacteroidales bacterium]|nr:tetratricopeptide repeat-containing sensor histidine kinase [Bacteroidales bacterium]
MKRILFHITLAFIFFSNSFAQDSNADSLLAMSRILTGNDLGRAYYELSLELKDSHTDSALYFANQAELILIKNDPDNLLPPLYKSKGKIYEIKLAYDRSLFYYRKAYDEFIKLENLHEIGSCALSMGHLHYEMADFSEAYYFYMHSLNAFERDGDRLGIAMMENNLGTVAHEMGKLHEAERHYLNAYEIYRENAEVLDECHALNNIGLILYDKNQYDSALVYFHEVIQKMNPDSLESDAEQYILSGVYNNMALAYIDLGVHEKALEYLRKGLTLARKIDDQYYIGSVYINLGSLFGEMNQQDSSLFYLHRALKIAKVRGFRHLELEAYNELSRLHAGLGSYMSAYNWQLRYDTVYKDLFNEKQSEQIARLRSRYEQEITDKEIEQLQSESQVQRMLNKVFIIFIVVIVALVIIIAINLRSKKITNQMLAERNLQISNAIRKLSESEKELQKLNKSKDRIFSVVAHDLRNPVAAVSGFSELLHDNFEQFSVETQKEYILQILQGTQRVQNLLENLLIWARSQMKAIKYEPGVLKMKSVVDECVKEMKANLDHKKINCIVKIDRKCVVFADKAMIYTIYRNLIMNAIKFSFPGGRIRITTENGTDMCNISVADEGIGIQPEIQNKLFDANEAISTPGTTGESGSGLGLIICKEFLERSNGMIRVESEPGNGSTFIVSLPLSSLE